MASGYCSACGARFVDSARFCGTCGKDLDAPKRAIASKSPVEMARIRSATVVGAPEIPGAGLPKQTEAGVPQLGVAPESPRPSPAPQAAATFGFRLERSAPPSIHPRRNSWADSREVTQSGFAAALGQSESLLPLIAMLVGMTVFVLMVGLALFAFGWRHQSRIPVPASSHAARPVPFRVPSETAPPAAAVIEGRIYHLTTDQGETVVQVLVPGTVAGEASPYWVTITGEPPALATGQWVRVMGVPVGSRVFTSPSGQTHAVPWLRATAIEHSEPPGGAP